jgi:hypothetical protein
MGVAACVRNLPEAYCISALCLADAAAARNKRVCAETIFERTAKPERENIGFGAA